MTDSVVVRPKGWFLHSRTRRALIGLAFTCGLVGLTGALPENGCVGALYACGLAAIVSASLGRQRIEASPGELRWIAGRQSRIVGEGGMVIAVWVIPQGLRKARPMRILRPADGKPVLLYQPLWDMDEFDRAVAVAGVEARLDPDALKATEFFRRYSDLPGAWVARMGGGNGEGIFWLVVAVCVALAVAGAFAY